MGILLDDIFFQKILDTTKNKLIFCSCFLPEKCKENI